MTPASPEACSLVRSSTIQRLARPRYEDLCPNVTPGTVGSFLTSAAAGYRQQIMRYDFMKHRGRDFDDPAAGWNRLLREKPLVRPFRLRVQRGTGKLPKLIPVYGIAPVAKFAAVIARLQELTDKNYTTLQPHYFDSFVRGNNPREDVVGWIDILNGFCWFVDEDMMRGTLRMLGLATFWNNSLDTLPWETTFIISSGKPPADAALSSTSPTMMTEAAGSSSKDSELQTPPFIHPGASLISSLSAITA